YPGFTSISGSDLALNIYNQVLDLGVDYIYKKACKVEVVNDKIKILTPDAEITANNLIIATGRSPRKLEVKMEDRLIGNGVSFCATCDSSLYKNKKVAVVGGGTSALEEAVYLSKICDSVTLIHRRDVFTAPEALIETVKSTKNINIITNSVVKEFETNDNKLSKIILEDKNKNLTEIDVDGCFEYIGQVPNTDIFKDLNILDEKGYVNVNDNYETSIPGIYAVGDCIKKDLYQVITACSDGATAANRIIKSKR
ncbi:MAG: FAD-dependent oxidoreductase, partial [Tenericutes bacterium]|nr:FAD-dependent oxidoreductase [Mycoplasmatota bacterium]